MNVCGLVWEVCAANAALNDIGSSLFAYSIMFAYLLIDSCKAQKVFQATQ